MELYGFGESGNAYKVALALRAMDVDWTLRPVDFFAGETRGPDFRALNPMGEVPVLVDGTTVLTQSAVILDYLSSKTGRFGGQSAAERREVLRWMFWDNHKLTGIVSQLRFMQNFLAPDKRVPEVIAYLRGRARTGAMILEDHLSAHGWVVGTAPTIADFSLAGYLYFPEEKGLERADWPAIDAWLERIAQIPGWAHPYDVMPRAFPGA
ncbi:glutathione S-transferase family protein [Rhodobaculum claviforme]|uniref:Glutathione S-transferase n=1 Tax=Rhodobaculum claviforme TaxID=1549854 RepID=A0A934WJ31_9RHOB|nr:glutathione S-transferase family protein [Rhodobaculum claviforme]MBK5927497.1 glutathione S-transferase [Rhodobaculum claviforme]